MESNFSIKRINELLNNYLQGKNDGTGTTKNNHPIQKVLNGANAKVTGIPGNTDDQTQLDDDKLITLDEDKAKLLEITISGTLSTHGIDDDQQSNTLKSTGEYKVFFHDAVKPYVTITDPNDSNKLKFQSLAEGWTFEFKNNPYPNESKAFKNLFGFDETGADFTYDDYNDSTKEIKFELDKNKDIQATTIFKKTANGNSKTVKVKYARNKNSSDQNTDYAISKRTLDFKRESDNDLNIFTELQSPFKFKNFSKSFIVKKGTERPEPIFSGDVSLELGSDEATQKTIEATVTNFQQKQDLHFQKSYLSKLGLEVKVDAADGRLFPEIGGTEINLKSTKVSMDYAGEVGDANEYSYTGELTGKFDADIKINNDTSLNGKIQYTAAKTNLSKTFYTQQVLGELTTPGIRFDEGSSEFSAGGGLYYGYYKYPEESSAKEGTVEWREVQGATGTLQLKNAPGLLNSIKISAGTAPKNLDDFASKLREVKPELLTKYITENKWGFTNANIAIANSTDKNPKGEIKLGPVSTSKISGAVNKSYRGSKGKIESLPFGFFKYKTGRKIKDEDGNSNQAPEVYGIEAKFEDLYVDLGFFAEPLKSISSAASSITDKVKPAVEFLTQKVNIADSLPGYLRTPIVEFIESTPGNLYRDNQIQVVELIDIANAAIKWSNNREPQSLTKPLYMVEQSLKFLDSLNGIQKNSSRLALGNIKWEIPLYKSTEEVKEEAKTETGKVISKQKITENQDKKIAKDLQAYENDKKKNNISNQWNNSSRQAAKYDGTFDIKLPLHQQPERFLKDLIFEDKVDLFALDLGLDYKQTYDLSRRIAAFPAMKIGLEGGFGLGIKTKIDAKLNASDLYNYAKNQTNPGNIFEEIIDNININLDQTKASISANLGLKLALDAVLAEASVSAGIEGEFALKPVLRKKNKEISDQSISVGMIEKALAKKKIYEARSTLKNLSYRYSIDFTNAASEQAKSNRYISINVPFETLNFSAEGDLIDKDSTQTEEIFLRISSTGWLKTKDSVNEHHNNQKNKKQANIEFDFGNNSKDNVHIRKQLKEHFTELYQAKQDNDGIAIDQTIDKIVDNVLDHALPESVVEYAMLTDKQNEPSTQIQYVSVSDSSTDAIKAQPRPLKIFRENSEYENALFYTFSPDVAETDGLNSKSSSTNNIGNRAVTYNTGKLFADDLEQPIAIEFSIGSTLDYEQLKEKLEISFGNDKIWKTLAGLTTIDGANATLIHKEPEEPDSKYRTILLIFSPPTNDDFSSLPNSFLNKRLSASNNDTLDIHFKLADDIKTETQTSTGIRQIVTTKNLSLGYTLENDSKKSIVSIPDRKEIVSEQYNGVNKIDSTFYAQSAWIRPNIENINQADHKSIVTDKFLKGAALIHSTNSDEERIESEEDLVEVITNYSAEHDLDLDLGSIDFNTKIIDRITSDPITNTAYQLTVYEGSLDDKDIKFKNYISIISQVSDTSNQPLNIIKIYDGPPIHDIAAINGNLLTTRRRSASDKDDIQIINIRTNESLEEQGGDDETSFQYSIQKDVAIPKQFTESALLNNNYIDKHSLRIGLYKIRDDQFTIAVSDKNNGNVYAATSNNNIFSNDVVQNLNQEYQDLSVNSTADNQDNQAEEESDSFFNKESFFFDQNNDNSFSKKLEQSLHTLHNITPGILLGGIVRSSSQDNERWLNGFADTFGISEEIAQQSAGELNDYKGYLRSFDFPEFHDLAALQEAHERSFYVTYAKRTNKPGADKTLVINTGIDNQRLRDLTRIYFSQPAEDRKIYPHAELAEVKWANSFDDALQTSVRGIYDQTSVLLIAKSNLSTTPTTTTVREQDEIETFTAINGLGARSDQEQIDIISSPNIISFKNIGRANHLKLAYNIQASNPQIKAFDIAYLNEAFPSLKITNESGTSLEQFYPLTLPYLNPQNKKSLDINITPETSIDFAGFDSTELERLKLSGFDPNYFLLRAPIADTIQLVGTDAEKYLNRTPIEKYSLLNHYYSHHDHDRQHPWITRRNQWSLPTYIKARSDDDVRNSKKNQSYFGFVNQYTKKKPTSNNIIDLANNHLESYKSGYQLILTNQGGLSLFNLKTNEEVWYAKNESGTRITGAKQAYMQPDGNFVLYEKPVNDLSKNGTSENRPLWEGNNRKIKRSREYENFLALTKDGTLAIVSDDTKSGHVIYSDQEENEYTLLKTSQALTRNNPIVESNGYKLELTDKGGLSLYRLETKSEEWEEIWFAFTIKKIQNLQKPTKYKERVTGAKQAFLQPDGNLVLYRDPVENLNTNGVEKNGMIYNSQTENYGRETTLKISDKGKLYIDGGTKDRIELLESWDPVINRSGEIVTLESRQKLTLTPSNQLLTITEEKTDSKPLFNFELPAAQFQLTTLGDNGKYESAMILSGSTKESSADAVRAITGYANSDPSSFSFFNPLDTKPEIEYNAKTIFSSIPAGKLDQQDLINLKTISGNNISNSQYNYSNVDTSFMLARGDDQVPRLLNVSTSDKLVNEFDQVKNSNTKVKAEVLYNNSASIQSQYETIGEFERALKNNYKQINLNSKTKLLNGNPHPYIEIRDNLVYSNKLNDQSIRSPIVNDNPTKLDLKLSAHIDAYLRADARLLWKSINLASLRIPLWEMDTKYIATGIVFAGETKLNKNSVLIKQNLNQKLVSQGNPINLLNKRIFAVEDVMPKNTAVSWILSKPNVFDTSVMGTIGIHLSTILKKQSGNSLTPKSALLTMPHHGSSDMKSLKERFDLVKRTLPFDLDEYLRPTLNKQTKVVNTIQHGSRLTKKHKNHLIDNYTLLSTLKAINWLSLDQKSLNRQTLKASQTTYALFIDYLKRLDNEGQRADLSSYQFYLDVLTFTTMNSKQSAPKDITQLAENLLHINQILREKLTNHKGNYSSLIDLISPLKSLAFDTKRLLKTDFSKSYNLFLAPDFPKQRQVSFAKTSSSSGGEETFYEVVINKPGNITSNGISKPISIRSDNLKYGQANHFFIEGFPDAPPSSLQIDPNQSQLKLSLKAGNNLTGNRIKGSIAIQLFDRFRQGSNHNQSNSLLHIFWNGSEFKSLENWSPIRPLLRQSGVRSSKQDQNLMVRRDAHSAFKTPMALFAYEQTPASLQSTKTLAEGSLSAQLSESSQYLLLEDDLFYTRSKRPQDEDQSDRFSERELVYEFNSDTNELKTYLRPIAPQEQLADSDESISIMKSEPIYFKKVPDQFRTIDTIIGKPSFSKQVATLKAPVADSPSATDALTFRVKSATSKLLLDLESFVDYSYIDIQLQSPEPTSTELVFLNKDDFNLDFSDSSSVAIKSIDSPTSDSLNLRLWDQNGESLSLYNFDT